MTVHLHMFKSKIHRATVTHANLAYEGSVTIPAELMEAAQILEHEQVHVWNVDQGTRLVTYAIRGESSGVICANGAAAHQIQPGDKVIIATFAEVPRDQAKHWTPTIVTVDEQNQPQARDYVETAGPN